MATVLEMKEFIKNHAGYINDNDVAYFARNMKAWGFRDRIDPHNDGLPMGYFDALNCYDTTEEYKELEEAFISSVKSISLFNSVDNIWHIEGRLGGWWVVDLWNPEIDIIPRWEILEAEELNQITQVLAAFDYFCDRVIDLVVELTNNYSEDNYSEEIKEVQ